MGEHCSGLTALHLQWCETKELGVLVNRGLAGGRRSSSRQKVSSEEEEDVLGEFRRLWVHLNSLGERKTKT